MMNPFEFAKRLHRYLSGEASAEEREEVERQLAADLEMAALATELQDKKRISAELQVMASFDTERALKDVQSRRHILRHRGWWWSVAALVAAGVGTWLLWVRQPEQPLRVAQVEEPAKVVTLEVAGGMCYALDTLSSLRLAQAEVSNGDGVMTWQGRHEERGTAAVAETAYNKVRVPYGSTYSLVLPDGTKVFLNSGTVFEFPSQFAGTERRVRVSGEAYYEVARDEHLPFIVEAGGMQVRVLGTVFNVKAYADEPAVYTTLVSGRVAVRSDGGRELHLQPGELATYSRENKTLAVAPADVEVETAWKNGMFYFKQLPLEEILRIVARWYDLDVFYGNAEVGEWRFNGKMPMYSSVEDVLKKFEYAGEVRFELQGRTLTVYKR